MGSVLLNWIVTTLAILCTAYIIPGVYIESLMTAFVAALILGILNAIVKPILFFLTLPITLVTLGLFTLVLNACMLLLTAMIVPGIIIDSFWWALLFSIVLSIITTFLHHLSGNKK